MTGGDQRAEAAVEPDGRCGAFAVFLKIIQEQFRNLDSGGNSVAYHKICNQDQQEDQKGKLIQVNCNERESKNPEENRVDEEWKIALLLVNKKNIEDVHSQSSLQNTHHGDGQSDEWQDSIEGDCIKAQPDGVFILRGFPWHTQVPLHYTEDRNGYLERSFDTSLHF